MSNHLMRVATIARILRRYRCLALLIGMLSFAAVTLWLQDGASMAGFYKSCRQSSSPSGPKAWSEEDVVELIQSITHKEHLPESPWGFKYETCLVTITRNQIYLKEFLVRNILAGFQLIVLVDDSRPDANDSNIANLVRPFVKAGVVVHEMAKDTLSNDMNSWGHKDRMMESYTKQHMRHCKWIARFDDDEILYPLGYPTERLPEWLKGVEDKYCEIRFNWLHPYSEGLSRRHGHRMGETLLRTFPRLCLEHFLSKCMIQSQKVPRIQASSAHWNLNEVPQPGDCLGQLTVLEQHGGHGTEPMENRTFAKFQQQNHLEAGMMATASPSPRPLLIHYYTKSLEDFLTKKEQSLSPHYRLFKNYYDYYWQCPLEFQQIPYSRKYIEDVERVMEIPFTEDPSQDRSGHVVEKPPMTLGEEELAKVPDYEEYLYVKKQIKAGKWLNQTCYYETYPEVLEAVKRRDFVDAMIYFASVGYDKNMLDCWQEGEEVVTWGHVPSMAE